MQAGEECPAVIATLVALEHGRGFAEIDVAPPQAEDFTGPRAAADETADRSERQHP